MAEQTIDKVQVEIEASAKNTNAAFTQLENQLKTLQRALNAIDLSKVKEINKAVRAAKPKIDTSGMSTAERNIKASTEKIQQSLAGLYSYANKSLTGDKSAFSSFEKQSTSLQSAIDVIKEKFKQLGDVALPTKQFEALDGKIEDTKSHLDSLKAKEREAKDSGGNLRISDNEYKDLIEDIVKTQTEISKLQSQQDLLAESGKAFYNPFAQYQQSIYDVQDALTNMTNQVHSAMANMQNAQAEPTALDRLSEKLNRDIPLGISKLKTDLAGLSSIQESALSGDKSAITSFERKVVTIRGEIEKLTEKLRQLEARGNMPIGILDNYRTAIQSISTKLDEMASKVKNAIPKQAGGASEGMKKTGDEATNAKKAVEKLGSAIKSLVKLQVKGLGKLSSAFTGIGKNATGSMNGAFMKLLKYGFGIRSLYVLFRRLRKAVVDSFGSLQNSGAFFETTRANIESLKSSLSTLKFQFGAAFEPIFNAVAPALQTLVNHLITVMNVISAFMAKLMGKSTYSKVSATFGKVASGAGSAGKAVKELNKQLQGFDELNNLTTNSPGGGGGGGGGGAGESGAQYVEASVDSVLGDFGKTLADKIREGDWKGVGQVISDKLSEAMESIPWPKIFEKAKNFGRDLAEFLNGLINPRLFANIGTTIGNAILTKLLFLNELGDKIEWINVGNSLAAGFDAFIKTGWIGKLGETLHTWISGGLNALTTFFTEADFEKVGSEIAKFIGNLNIPELAGQLWNLAIAILEALADAIKGFWEDSEITGKIGLAIVGVIGFAKLSGLGVTLATLIKGALVGQTLSITSPAGFGLKLTGLALTIGSLFISDANLGTGGLQGLFEREVFNLLGGVTTYSGLRMLGFSPRIAAKITLIKVVWDTAFDLTLSFGEWISNQIGDYELAEYYKNFSWKDFFPDIAEAAETGNLKKGIELMFGGNTGLQLKGIIDSLPEEDLKKYEEFKNIIGDISSNFKGLNKELQKTDGTSKTFIKHLKSLGNTGKQSARDINNGFNGMPSDVAEIFRKTYVVATDEFSESETWASNTKTKIEQAFAKLKGEVPEDFKIAYGVSTGAWSGAAKWASDTSQWIQNGFTTMPTGIAESFGQAYTDGTAKFNQGNSWASKTAKSIQDGFASMPGAIGGKFGDAYTQGTNKFTGAFNWAVTVADKIKNGISSVPGNFDKAFLTASQNAQTRLNAFRDWFGKQNYNKTATLDAKLPDVGPIQQRWNEISAIWNKKIETELSITTGGTFDMGGMVSAMNTLIDRFNYQMSNWVQNGLASGAAALFRGVSVKPMGHVWMAKGGILDEPTNLIAGEAGTEAILPLENNTQWLGKIAGMIVGEMAKPSTPVIARNTYNNSGYSGTSSSDLAEQNRLLQEQNDLLRQIASKELIVSSEEVFNANRKEANNYYNRTGNSPFLF